MKLIFLALILFQTFFANSQKSAFVEAVEHIVNKDTIISKEDLLRLLEYQVEVREVYKNIKLRTEKFELFKRLQKNIAAYGKYKPNEYDSTTSLLNSEQIYILGLIKELGSKTNLNSQRRKYQRWYNTANVFFGQGFSHSNSSNKYAGRTMWGADDIVNFYIRKHRRTRFFVTPGLGVYSVLQDSALKGIIASGIGVGYDATNTTSISVSSQYLRNLADGEYFWGMDVSFITQSFQFGSKLFFHRDQEYSLFFTIKYDIWRAFRNPRY